MNWIISEIHNLPLILCGVFYSVLCIFSIVTGMIYASGKKELNPLELSKKFMKKLDTDEKLRAFTIKMGWITFIVGIVQGLTAFAIFKGYNTVLNLFAIGFTIFSILSVSFKLKGKRSFFAITKLIFYSLILIILLLAGVNTYAAEEEIDNYLKSSEIVNVSKIKNGYYFDGPGTENAIIFFPGARVQYTAYSKLMFKLAENGQDCFLLAMPLNLAFFNINVPNKIMSNYNYESYYISGHSLGGVVANKYVIDNPGNIKGVIVLASYPTNQLPSNIEYISFYGSNDNILNLEKYQDSKKYLPEGFKEYIVNGGNHSGFANYGNQKGDGISTITSDEQQEQIVNILK